MAGNVIGVHDGIINFTIGQRKGIKIADKNPLYVIKIDSLKNEIIVGEKRELEVDEIKLRDLNFLCENIKKYNSNLFVKIRSTGPLIKTNIFFENDLIKIKLDKKESGISPGQACVFYSKTSIGDKVLGGGWIDSNN